MARREAKLQRSGLAARPQSRKSMCTPITGKFVPTAKRFPAARGRMPREAEPWRLQLLHMQAGRKEQTEGVIALSRDGREAA